MHNLFKQNLLVLDIWRTGQLKLFLLTLILVVASFSASEKLFGQLEASLGHRVSQLVGSDRELSQSSPIPSQWLLQAEMMGLKQTQITELDSMLASESAFQLSNLLVVEDNYPIKGQVLISQTLAQTKGTLANYPNAGEIWLSPKIAKILQVDVGKQVIVGKKPLTVSAIILREPGDVSGLVGLAPRALINHQDLDATGLIRPGSRVGYRWLLGGTEKDLELFHQWLAPKLENEKQWKNPNDEQTSGRILKRIRAYLAIITLIALIMGCATLAMAGYRFAQQQRKRVALWRCMGASRSQLLGNYSQLILWVSVVGSLLGLFLGLLLGQGVLTLVQQSIPLGDSVWRLQMLFMPLFSGMLLVITFLFPVILMSIQQPPLAVLRCTFQTLKIPFSHWAPGILCVMGIAAYWSSSLKFWLGFGLGFVILSFLLKGLSSLMINVSLKLAKNRTGVLAVVSSLMRTQKKTSSLQLMVISLVLGLFGVVSLSSQNLLSQWQNDLPENTPNLFLFNVSEPDIEPIDQNMTALNIDKATWYPIVRGRLTHLNGVLIRDAIRSEASEDGALRRELNLTWTTQLSPDNKIVEGEWPPNIFMVNEVTENGISVEQGLATRLDLKLGDQLGFQVGSLYVDGVITSLRTVQWDSFRPNFFIIFPEKSLEQVATTYLSSFYIPQQKTAAVEESLRQFPTVSVIATRKLLEQVSALIAQAGMIVQASMVFLALLSMVLVFSVLLTTYQERLFQGLVIRAVGGGNQFILRMMWIEWLLLGSAAGFAGAFLTEFLYNGIAAGLLELEWKFHPLLWIIMPIAAILILFLSAIPLSRKLTQQSPMLLLKETG